MALKDVCPCGSDEPRATCDQRPLRVCVDCGRPFHANTNAAVRCERGCRQARVTLMERHKKRRQRGSRHRQTGERLPTSVVALGDSPVHGNMRVVKSDADGVGERPSTSEEVSAD